MKMNSSPDPQQVFGILLLELARRNNSGVNEQVRGPQIAGARVQETEMRVGQALEGVLEDLIATP